MTKIVSLNIRHGGGKRQSALASWLIRADADQLVLTEWRKGSATLGALLEGAGYTQALALRADVRANGVAIFSREKCLVNRATPPNSQRGELLFSRANGLSVLGAYFPQKQAKSVFFQRCAELVSKEAEPLLLIGDLNTGCNVRDIEAGGARFHCARDFIELTATCRLTDLWRRQHGEEAREWTWRSTKNGFRIDHAFVNREFLDAYPKATCRIDHLPRETGFSDHSALIVEMNSGVATTRSSASGEKTTR